MPTPKPVTASARDLLLKLDQFPLSGYRVSSEGDLQGDGGSYRNFSSSDAAIGNFYVRVRLLQTGKTLDSGIDNSCVTLTATQKEDPFKISLPFKIGEKTLACRVPIGSKVEFQVYAGTRNMVATVMATVDPLRVSDDDALDMVAYLAERQIAVIDQASPSGVTSTALTYKGTQSILDGATFPSTMPAWGTVSYKGADGKTVTVVGFPGLVNVWVPVGMSTDASEMQFVAEIFGGKVVGQVPSMGLYQVQVAGGKEGDYINNMRSIGLEASPTLALSVQTKIEDARLPHALQIDAPQVQLDDFKNPLCVKNCNQTPDKRLYLALPVAPGFPYGTTSDPSKALTHGMLVQYLRLGRVIGTDEPTLSLDITNPIGLTDTVAVIQDWNSVFTNLRLVFGAADDSLTTTVNLSLGPSCRDRNGILIPGCSQSANQTFLNSLERLVKVANAEDKILLVLSAGNDGSNVSMPPSVTSDPAWSSIIRVGALYPNGTELNPVSNYSIDDDILYVPVMHAMLVGISTEECVACMGTSFAAPQIDYLVGEIARNRADLTPSQLKQILFDPELSPRKTIDGSNGLKLQARVILDPYDPATLQTALKIAQRLFLVQEPQLPGQQPPPGQPTPITPLGRRNFNLPLAFKGTARLPDAEAGKCYDFWFCKNPPASPAFFCGVNDTSDPVGGHPPYHFQLGPLGGFPPFGLILNTNGHLAGTINPAAGRSTPYTFTVCVYDLDGKNICQPTSLLVKAVPTPTPTPTPTRTPTPTPTRTPTPTSTPTPQTPVSGSVSSISCKVVQLNAGIGGTVDYYDAIIKGTASGPVNSYFNGGQPTCDSWGRCRRGANDPPTTQWTDTQRVYVSRDPLANPAYNGATTNEISIGPPYPSRIILPAYTKVCP